MWAQDKNKDEKEVDIPVCKILPRLLVPPKHDVNVEMKVVLPDLTKMIPACTVSEPKVVPSLTAVKPIDGKSKIQPQVSFKDVKMVDEANKDKFMGKPKHALLPVYYKLVKDHLCLYYIPSPVACYERFGPVQDS